jgi:hypothetical protein
MATKHDPELIERVAKRLFSIHNSRTHVDVIGYETISGDDRSLWRLMARGACEEIGKEKNKKRWGLLRVVSRQAS